MFPLVIEFDFYLFKKKNDEMGKIKKKNCYYRRFEVPFLFNTSLAHMIMRQSLP